MLFPGRFHLFDCTVKDLRSILRPLRIKYYYKLRKAELIEHVSAFIIQTYYKKHKKGILNFPKHNFLNDVDPITQMEIRGPAFVLVEDPLHVYKFDPVKLGSYFLQSGKFQNPFTRYELNDAELFRLNCLLWRMGHCEFPNFVRHRSRIRIDRMAQEEHERATEFFVNECIDTMEYLWAYPPLRHINIRNFGCEQSRLLNQVLPTYRDRMSVLMMHDQRAGVECKHHIMRNLNEVLNSPDYGIFLKELASIALDIMEDSRVQVLPAVPIAFPDVTTFVNSFLGGIYTPNHINSNPIF